MSKAWLATITFIVTLAFAVAPFFGNEFGGYNPEHFPVPQKSPFVQPAGYAFAIWGLIYLWLFFAMGFGLFKTTDHWHKMRIPLVISLTIGAAWLQVAVVSPVWGTVLIWTMLVLALLALFRSPSYDKWLAELPVGLYAGWLSAASCVSLGLLAAGYGLTSELSAALGAIFLALIIAASVQSKLKRAPSFGLGVIWALVAIIVQNMDGTGHSAVASLATGGAMAMLVPTWKAARG